MASFVIVELNVLSHINTQPGDGWFHIVDQVGFVELGSALGSVDCSFGFSRLLSVSG